MNYELWQLFVDVVKSGNLTKVSLYYGISQSQISRKIRVLEDSYNKKLLFRTGRGVSPTSFAQNILPAVEDWLKTTNDVENNIKQSAGYLSDKVSIAMIPSVAHIYGYALYSHMREYLPNAKLSIKEGQGTQIDKWLKEGSIDIAILYRYGDTKRNGELFSVKSDTFLIGGKRSELTKHTTIHMRNLDDVPLTTFCRPNMWRNVLDRLFSDHNIQQNIILEADSLTLQRNVVHNGDGYALFGAYAAMLSREAGLEISKVTTGAKIPRYITLAVPLTGVMTPTCRATIDFIREMSTWDTASITSQLLQ